MFQTQTAHQTNNHSSKLLLDEDGFLIDTFDWTPAFTTAKAVEANVELNEKHWLLIDMIRDKYLRLGALPPMRTICKTVGVNKQEVKNQFGSCLNLWRIAGLPNPGEEAKTYMN